jgi:hypothetical protein
MVIIHYLLHETNKIFLRSLTLLKLSINMKSKTSIGHLSFYILCIAYIKRRNKKQYAKCYELSKKNLPIQ